MVSRFRMSALILVGAVFVVSSSCAGEDEPQSGGWSWSSFEGHWKRRTRYRNVKGYAERPQDLSSRRFHVEWEPPERNRLGNICTIRGTVSLDEDGRRNPVKWFQGITVYLAATGDAAPDWSKGMSEQDTVGEIGTIDRNGQFEIQIDLEETKHGRLGAENVQIGIALADHFENGAVEWNSRRRAEPGTIQRVNIPAAPEIAAELQLVHDARHWPDDSGVKLIRAVNALQRVGKERALGHLEEYTRLADGPEYSWTDLDVVFWIIRLLFEPARAGDRIPSPAIAWALLIDHDSPAVHNWPIEPVACVNGIPFMAGHGINIGGRIEHPTSHILWARRFGVIRDKPMRPTSSPLEAAEALVSSRRFQLLIAEEHELNRTTRKVLNQALAMLPRDSNPLMSRYGDKDALDKEWRERLAAMKRRDIVWDEDRQTFVARKGDE